MDDVHDEAGGAMEEVGQGIGDTSTDTGEPLAIPVSACHETCSVSA